VTIEVLEKPIRVLHFMESLGIGGGQIMMFELSNGLNKYFGNECQSFVAGAKPSAGKVVVQPKLLETYNIPLLKLSYSDLGEYCKKNNIDVVVHHRVSISTPVRKHIPKNIPYIVVSHTAASLGQIRKFYVEADYIVSVCKHLFNCSPKEHKMFKNDRMVIILNGIENDFIKDIEPAKLGGVFKTGRCHRLVPTKFALDSIGFFEINKPRLLGHVHYLMGTGNKALPAAGRNKETICYLGEITDRDLKYSIIKALDVYFYEIAVNEGASIAVLEGLASGVPVVCLKKGGIKELVKNEHNGFIEKNRDAMLKRLIQLKSDKNLLEKTKQNVVKDFDDRLHVRHCARKYMKLFRRALACRKK